MGILRAGISVRINKIFPPRLVDEAVFDTALHISLSVNKSISRCSPIYQVEDEKD